MSTTVPPIIHHHIQSTAVAKRVKSPGNPTPSEGQRRGGIHGDPTVDTRYEASFTGIRGNPGKKHNVRNSAEEVLMWVQSRRRWAWARSCS